MRQGQREKQRGKERQYIPTQKQKQMNAITKRHCHGIVVFLYP